jgi:hypothetical protein
MIELTKQVKCKFLIQKLHCKREKVAHLAVGESSTNGCFNLWFWLGSFLRMYIEKRAWSYNVIGCATTLDPL